MRRGISFLLFFPLVYSQYLKLYLSHCKSSITMMSRKKKRYFPRHCFTFLYFMHVCNALCFLLVTNHLKILLFFPFLKPMKEAIRSHTPMKETTTVEIWTHPQPQVWREHLISSLIDFYECIKIFLGCISRCVFHEISLGDSVVGFSVENMTGNTYFFLVWFDNSGDSLFVGGTNIPLPVSSK